ncbi:MAG: FHA domain-containing protein, partial [Gemmataceae bacterium]|nr:FHA domain-containing protein [Gemmataceae bacterium]
MGFHLHNAQTGETLKLPPDRTLIGAAEHATIRTAGGPYLAALVVKYPSGWTMFALSDDAVRFNRQPFRAGQRVRLKKGDALTIGDERFTFLAPQGQNPEQNASQSSADVALPDDPPPADLFVYVTSPDGMEECRAVDHDLLFGRLSFCHVQLADTRLSRLSALLAADGKAWYLHCLSKKPLGRNRKPVQTAARVTDGDELLIGPLVVRVELKPSTAERLALGPAALTGSRERAAFSPAASTDVPEHTDTPGPRAGVSGSELLTLHARGERFERWL